VAVASLRQQPAEPDAAHHHLAPAAGSGGSGAAAAHEADEADAARPHGSGGGGSGAAGADLSSAQGRPRRGGTSGTSPPAAALRPPADDASPLRSSAATTPRGDNYRPRSSSVSESTVSDENEDEVLLMHSGDEDDGPGDQPRGRVSPLQHAPPAPGHCHSSESPSSLHRGFGHSHGSLGLGGSGGGGSPGPGGGGWGATSSSSGRPLARTASEASSDGGATMEMLLGGGDGLSRVGSAVSLAAYGGGSSPGPGGGGGGAAGALNWLVRFDFFCPFYDASSFFLFSAKLFQTVPLCRRPCWTRND
jgi:hypothetical protein